MYTFRSYTIICKAQNMEKWLLFHRDIREKYRVVKEKWIWHNDVFICVIYYKGLDIQTITFVDRKFYSFWRVLRKGILSMKLRIKAFCWTSKELEKNGSILWHNSMKYSWQSNVNRKSYTVHVPGNSEMNNIYVVWILVLYRPHAHFYQSIQSIIS